MGNKIDHRCAVLGKPISHSLSPVLHNAAYKSLGLTDWHYTRVEVGEEDLAHFLQTLDSSWAGLSLTMPLKRTIQPYGTACDTWSRRLLVANTAVFDWSAETTKPNIRLYNTDVEGIGQAFDHFWRISHCEARNKLSNDIGEQNGSANEHQGAKAVILGNGNTALSAMAACTEMMVPESGAIAKVTVCARHHHDNDPMKRLAESKPGLSYHQVPLREAVKHLVQADVVINTIPAHGADETAGLLEEIFTGSSPTLFHGTLLDVVYDPCPTRLMKIWRKGGGKVIGGEEMLLYQAIAQVRLMTVGAHTIGTADFEQAMRSALQEAL